VLTWLARLIVHLYPSAWRERYEAEVLDLLEATPLRLRDLNELVQGLVLERWRQLAASPESPRRTEAVLVLFGPVTVLATVLVAIGAGRMLRGSLGAWPPDWASAGEWVVIAVVFAALPLRWAASRLARRPFTGLVVLLALLIVVVAGSAWGDLVRFEGFRGRSDSMADLMALLLFWFLGGSLTRGFWPDRTILDAIDRREVAQQQLDMSRAWVEGCHRSAASGLPVPLEEAEAQVVQWEDELREADAAVETMGYRARFQSRSS